MTPSWLLMSLLLLSVLSHEAQGIRLIIKGTLSNDHQHINHKILQARSNGDMNEVILCKGNHCSERVRKLMGSPISSTRRITKNQNYKKKAKKDENLSVDSRRQPETYPGVLDIAGMDYSQARRKPPIHN